MSLKSKGVLMRAIKIFVLSMFLVPVLFVMGTIASSAEVLSPFVTGGHRARLEGIVRTGECLKSATEGLTRKEIVLLHGLLQNRKVQSIFNLNKGVYRIKRMAEQSV